MIKRLLLLLVVTTTAATAQTTTPNVDQVIETYLHAVGGEAAIAKFKTRVCVGTTEIAGIQGKGEFAEFYKAPNKMAVRITFPSVGVILYGYDGVHGWRRDPASGLIDLRDKQLAELAFDSMFNSEYRPKERYTQLELDGLKKMDGKDVYLIIAKAPKLSTEKLYFDSASGLLVKMEVTRSTEAGPETDIVYLDDYREVDGVKFPFVELHKSSGFTFTLRFTSIKHDVAIEDSLFAKPVIK